MTAPGVCRVDQRLMFVTVAGAELVAAGGRLVHPATDRDWGGRSAYVADPDGYRWEIACNPGAIGQRLLAQSQQWHTAYRARQSDSEGGPDHD
ncbi:VOC family protein [Actinomycetota bacterium]